MLTPGGGVIQNIYSLYKNCKSDGIKGFGNFCGAKISDVSIYIGSLVVGKAFLRIKGSGLGGIGNKGNISKKLDTRNISNMTKKQIIKNRPKNWTYTERNGFVHIIDTTGRMRIRIDPPDNVTKYPHVHVYDTKGNLFNIFGKVVNKKSPQGHIPYRK